MRYRFRNIAMEAGEDPDFFYEAEEEFNHVINPKLKLTQDALTFLANDVPGYMKTDGIEALFEPGAGEPIIPLYPFRVNERFQRLRNRMVKDVLALSPSMADSCAMELALLSELEAALAFIKKHGDVRLGECLTEGERSSLPPDKIPERIMYDEIVRLSDILPDLVLSKEFDKAIRRPRISPRGRAVYWSLIESSRLDHVANQLNRRVTDHYRLPPADSYEFLPWKYLTEIRGFLFPPGEFWEDNEPVLTNLGLSPLNHHSQYGGCDWSEYVRLRIRWVKQGVDASGFCELEQQFMSHLGGNFLKKNEIVSQWPTFVLGRIFMADNAFLYNSLEREAHRLLRRVTNHFRPDVEKADPNLVSQAAHQLKCTLESDPLMFMVFYGNIFVLERLPEISGGSGVSPIHPRGTIKSRRGRPATLGKQIVAPIQRLLVDLLKRHRIPYAHDRAAEMLNALALRKVYPTDTLGEVRISATQGLVDKRASKRAGYLTTGGKLLYDELLKGTP